VRESIDLQEAAEVVHAHTLAKMPRLLDQFIYLASLRDGNSGLYHHEELADRFGPEVACQVLADCHREVCRQLFACSLDELVTQMLGYMKSPQARSRDFISLWKELEPYRAAVPVRTERISAQFLFSNFRIALAIAEERLAAPAGVRSAD
jgi:hypothetical protein